MASRGFPPLLPARMPAIPGAPLNIFPVGEPGRATGRRLRPRAFSQRRDRRPPLPRRRPHRVARSQADECAQRPIPDALDVSGRLPFVRRSATLDVPFLLGIFIGAPPGVPSPSPRRRDLFLVTLEKALFSSPAACIASIDQRLRRRERELARTPADRGLRTRTIRSPRLQTQRPAEVSNQPVTAPPRRPDDFGPERSGRPGPEPPRRRPAPPPARPAAGPPRRRPARAAGRHGPEPLAGGAGGGGRVLARAARRPRTHRAGGLRQVPGAAPGDSRRRAVHLESPRRPRPAGRAHRAHRNPPLAARTPERRPPLRRRPARHPPRRHERRGPAARGRGLRQRGPPGAPPALLRRRLRGDQPALPLPPAHPLRHARRHRRGPSWSSSSATAGWTATGRSARRGSSTSSRRARTRRSAGARASSKSWNARTSRRTGTSATRPRS